MDHVPMKNKRTTLERAEKFISTHHFKDVNLRGRLYPTSRPVTSIKTWAAPQGVYTPFKKAVKQEYQKAKLGQQFGPTWATHWFHVEIDVPAYWEGEEVRLRWNSGSEALVWLNGEPVQGLSSEFDRLDFPLTECLSDKNLHFSVYIEMACNGMFGAGDNGTIEPLDLNRQFTLACCEVAVFDRKVYNLIRDVEMLYDLAKHLPEDSERGYQALYTVNDVINACDVFNTETFPRMANSVDPDQTAAEGAVLFGSTPFNSICLTQYLGCHKIAQGFLSQKNGDSQHTTYAMGHSHIDTAWLWPYSETIRKCARSWSCTIRLMEKYPAFMFTCSQAQQYEWVKEQYPGLYEHIKKFVKTGQFIPVGGTWVEMDGLVPSGEAFIRQFLYGQRYFKKEFGITCKEFWLPDTFGYSAQLPQIMRHCGISRFLTQKMSWNLVNKFPHHTFWWEGIDGSEVLSHFPPGDSYEMKGTVNEVLRTAKNFRDKGRSDKTAFLFGFGDGGNGPSEDMIERLQRMTNVDGLPRVKLSTPDDLFSRIESEDGEKLCRWAGELYLELHNGTYTTHARVKKMNRKCELLLQDVEFVSIVAMVTQKGSKVKGFYNQEELDRLWKLLLLNQFHDVLPGSSIGMVYEDAHKYYNDIMKSGTNMFEKAVALACKGKANSSGHVIWNTQSWERSEVIALPGSQASTSSPAGKKRKVSDEKSQKDSDGNTMYCVTVPSYGYSYLSPMEPETSVQIKQEAGGFYFENDLIEARIDKSGRVTELFVKGSKRNAISGDHPANHFILYDDIPLFWDAWDVMDYHLETRKPVEAVINEAQITESGPLRVAVKFSLEISKQSRIEQTISLDVGSPYLKFSTQVVWHENHKFLKVEFPTSVHTREATYDIQMGHLKRPTHYNTSWDWARFEVCGHKWTDLSEFGFGVAVLNDCKYGHSAVDNIIRMSLLRSPKAPDKMADMETHTFTYALMPHLGTFQEAGVIQHAYALNSPLYVQPVDQTPPAVETASFFTLGSPQVVLETVKKSEDQEDALVLRLYESFGGKCSTYLSTTLPFKSVHTCNGLEDVDDGVYSDADLQTESNKIHFTIKPFQILSLKLFL